MSYFFGSINEVVNYSNLYTGILISKINKHTRENKSPLVFKISNGDLYR